MNTVASKPSMPGIGLAISHAPDRETVGVPAANFTGAVELEMLFAPDGPDRTSAGLVSFPPGARTHWHSHPLGQTLVVTAGVGRIQREGGPVQEIRAGDVARIPPGVKHWHGASANSGMSHIAIQEAHEGKTADWMEPVSDGQYEANHASQASTERAGS
jgi:4-carboxymuconolactone decarboxylase